MLKEMDIRLFKEKYSMNIKGIIQVGSYVAKEYPILKEVCLGDFIFIDANEKIIELLRSNLDDNCKIFNNLIADVDDQEFTFNLMNHEQSSSVLELDKHSEYHPEYSKIVEQVKIKSVKLDTLIKKEKIDMHNYNCLIMDVQGAELLVLKGFEQNLDCIDYIHTELNFESMYKNCCLEKDLTEYLKNKNFSLVESFNTGFGWGDGLYIKNYGK